MVVAKSRTINRRDERMTMARFLRRIFRTEGALFTSEETGYGGERLRNEAKTEEPRSKPKLLAGAVGGAP
jgi:hypothetical protein